MNIGNIKAAAFSTFIRNVGTCLQVHTASEPRPPWIAKVYLHAFLSLSLQEDKRSASRPDLMSPSTLRAAGWVCPRNGLDASSIEKSLSLQGAELRSTNSKLVITRTCLWYPVHCVHLYITYRTHNICAIFLNQFPARNKTVGDMYYLTLLTICANWNGYVAPNDMLKWSRIVIGGGWGFLGKYNAFWSYKSCTHQHELNKVPRLLSGTHQTSCWKWTCSVRLNTVTW
jgi:hypothetical protein